MVPDIGRIVTRAAEPGNTRPVEHVVQSAHPGDIDQNTVEDVLAAGDSAARRNGAVLARPITLAVLPLARLVTLAAILRAGIGGGRPGIVEVENHRIEGGTGGVEAKWIVGANKELGNSGGQRNGATIGAGVGEPAGTVVVDLRGKDAGALRRAAREREVQGICRRAKCRRAPFEANNLLPLGRSWGRCRLCMSERRVNRLLKQVRLAAIPHDRAQETQIRGGQHSPVER